MCLMFKLQYGTRVPFFNDYIRLRSEVHNYPTSSSNDDFLLCTLLPRSSYGYATFYFRAIKCWNELPTDIKKSNSLAMFKTKLKKHYLNSQKSRLNL